MRHPVKTAKRLLKAAGRLEWLTPGGRVNVYFGALAFVLVAGADVFGWLQAGARILNSHYTSGSNAFPWFVAWLVFCGVCVYLIFRFGGVPAATTLQQSQEHKALQAAPEAFVASNAKRKREKAPPD